MTDTTDTAKIADTTDTTDTTWRTRLAGPALVLVIVLTTLTIGLAARRPGVENAGGAARFVPADGRIDAALLRDASGARSERIVQHGRLSGATIVTSVPSRFDSIPEILAEQHISLQSAQLWTQSSQEFSGDSAADRVQVVSVIAPTGIADVMIYGGPISFVYSPPIITLPAAPTVGATWTQQGDALPQSVARYDVHGTVIAAPAAEDRADGCLATRSEVRYSLNDAAHSPLLTISSTDTWCPGRGIVRSSGTVTGDATTPLPTITDVALGDLQVVRRPLTHVSTAASPVDASYRLAPDPVPVSFDDVLLGESDVAATTAFTPMSFSGDLIVVVDTTSGDLVGVHDDSTRLTEVWRRHPGGTILSATAAAGLVVVTSADRRVTAYTPEGVPRWTHVLDDIVTTGATSANDIVVMGTMAGTVYGIRAGDGDIRWHHDLPDVVRCLPASTGALAVLALHDGSTAALTATGRRAWTVSSGNVEAVLADSERIAVVTTDDVVAQLDPASGEELAQLPLTGTFRDAVLANGRLVVTTDEQTIEIDAGSDQPRWTADASLGALPTTTGVILRTPTGLRVIDGDGTEVASWPYDKAAVTDPRFASAADWLVPSGDTVLVVDENLLVARLAAGGRP